MADSTVQTNIGPIVIAVTINTFLYGVCFLQFIRYFTAGHRDILATKLLVCWELAIDTCHSAIGIYTLWLFVVDNFMNEAFIGATPWPIPSVPIFSALSAVPIQIYLSYRIKTQFGNWIVFSILLVLVLSSGIMFIVMGASAIQKTTYAHLSLAPSPLSVRRLTFLTRLTKMKHIESLIKSALALTAATDTSLSAVLVWCLRKRTSSRQSDHVISRLIRGAIESACTASVFGIMAVISYRPSSDLGIVALLSKDAQVSNPSLSTFMRAWLYQRSSTRCCTKLKLERRKRYHAEMYQKIIAHIEAIKNHEADNTKSLVGPWTHLINNSEGDVDFNRAFELLPTWKELYKDGKDELKEYWGESLIIRTTALVRPDIAFDLFCNYDKYRVPLSQRSARRILYSLQKHGRLPEILIALSLYKTHDLQHFAEDLVSVIILLGALPRFYTKPLQVTLSAPALSEDPVDPKEITADRIRIAAEDDKTLKEMYDMLLQVLRQLLSKARPTLYRQKLAVEGRVVTANERRWLKDTLRSVHAHLLTTKALEDYGG
ncbi:hypothetical protein D9757_009106 [Collybiopsis confluens]|uniref:Uncharacterized protein n=1 Tax=Collybiopsis confluens TaxID=2823264 RepID=A0A8H5H8P3_9AGAR|nr:hypothetical protein D9757_009106 [Collybiopsis confluens]